MSLVHRLRQIVTRILDHLEPPLRPHVRQELDRLAAARDREMSALRSEFERDLKAAAKEIHR